MFKSVSWSHGKSVMELFLSKVYKFLLIANVARISYLYVVGALDLPLLLNVLFFRVIFLKVVVSEFVLTFWLLWRCTLLRLIQYFFVKIYSCLLYFHIIKFSSKRVFLLSYLNCHEKVYHNLI